MGLGTVRSLLVKSWKTWISDALGSLPESQVSVQCLNLGCEHLVPQASLEVLDLVNTSIMS